jgi:hypothetical protein
MVGEAHGVYLEAKMCGMNAVSAGELERRIASTAMAGEQYPPIRAKPILLLFFFALLQPRFLSRGA